jgi:hypothetical protein
MAEPIRLSKLMSERGLCSRREADSYIERGLVFVDGKRVSELGTKVDPNCVIRLDNAANEQQQQRVTLLLHKPVGYVSGQPEPGYQPAVTLIRPDSLWQDGRAGRAFHPTHLKGLAPAGRLDIDSTGLLVLTQDGRIAKQLIGDDSEDREGIPGARRRAARRPWPRPAQSRPIARRAQIAPGAESAGRTPISCASFSKRAASARFAACANWSDSR